jgi:DegV family protein with EDD domain
MMDPARRLDAATTALLTDSSVDIAAAARPANWRVVPIMVVFGDEAFRDGIDLDAAAFYRRLAAADRLPTTAQPSVEELATAMRTALERFDSVVVLHLSEKLSGTAEAARAAARAVGEERVLVLESHAASLALALLCLRVQARLEAGTTAGELTAAVEALRTGLHTGVAPETLEYLQRGGRIGRAQAAAGSLLRVRPILVLEDGAIGPCGRVRGAGRVVPALVDLVTRASDPDRVLRCAYAHAEHPAAVAELEAAVLAARPLARTEVVCEVGPTIGTHVGPGTFAVSFLHDPLDG